MSFALESAPLLEALLALRDPLSRIALATSDAQRPLSPEQQQRHAELVQGALADADARIDELARALGGQRAAALEPSADCRTEFAAVCRRAAIAPRARGIALDAITSSAPIPGDAAQVRRAALRLLRVACAWAGASGSVRLTLSRADGGPVLACAGERASAPPRAARLRDLLNRFALAEGARLCGAESLAGDALALSLALPGEPAP